MNEYKMIESSKWLLYKMIDKRRMINKRRMIDNLKLLMIKMKKWQFCGVFKYYFS